MSDEHVFELGDVVLQSGMTLRDAKLVYTTYGTLNRRRDNVILFPTFYGGQHPQNEPMIGPGMALDPAVYFIIVPNMFGNGLSSSPSNTPPPYDRARFPPVTLYDNIMCQHRLVTEQFGVERLALVTGFSMGAQQTFHWGALFPDMVERILPWCGSARTSRHNFVFLEGVKAALTADDAWRGGWYDTPPTKGLRALARVYSGWVVSQAFYREQTYLQLGTASLEDFLVMQEGRRLNSDANNLLAMLWSWQQGDISANDMYNGDFEKALGAISAKAIVMPSQTDLYFPPEDNEWEVQHMPNAEFRPIPSIWGHMAGSPGVNPVDTAFIDRALKELLTS
ncbi:alpha/beta fold hydrolase [Candidatus Entotheonella palauensis]|nr:alpha/beta fold hydrolase [Candidatus Entotheonella palauensis]